MRELTGNLMRDLTDEQLRAEARTRHVTAWLIERNDAHLALGKICGGAALGWVVFTDENALRFESKEAAEGFIHHHGMSHQARAVEHGWVSPPAEEKAAAAPAACSHCGRQTGAKPKSGCASLSHWQIWSVRLLTTILDASGSLYDERPMDLEHTIECHPDNVIPLLRSMSAAYLRAHNALQEIVHETLEPDDAA